MLDGGEERSHQKRTEIWPQKDLPNSLGRFRVKRRLGSRVGWDRRAVFLKLGFTCGAQPKKDLS